KYTDRDTGYLVMDEVGFYKTTNRGQNWAHVTNAIGEYELSITSHNIGYSAGTSVKIYKAEGNLESWRKLILNEDFSDVFFINEYTGFVITSSGQGKLFKTENGGVNWQIAVGAPGGGEILFIDSVTGFIGSSNGNIYKTTDGGHSWYPTNGVPNNIGKIQFVTNQTGWAAGGPVILKTNDGGENWATQVTSAADNFTSLYFVDSVNGWATSRYIWQTTNGGVNWIKRTDIPSFFSKDVYFTHVDTGFIINRSMGNNLISTKDGGLTWQIDSTIDAGYNFCYFPNKYHWIVNGVHQKWETDNNALHWNNITPALPSVINNFHSPNDWIGYAVGGAGLVLQYEDTSFLPVELLTFQGSFENDETVKLQWMTASELNNMGFEIQKSFNKEYWFTIGFIRGKGTSIEVNNYTFFDREIKSGSHYYRLKQIDYSGGISYSTIISMDSDLKPSAFKLSQNFPNPFNSRTIIKYQVPIKSFISLSLYNIKGERITELVSEEKETGLYQLAINNLALPSGIYFVRMKTSHGFAAMIKITLIK
ncbi:MAG: T9SS type A sorting domain-containing protein, partial [Ignavibacteriaceae bacterium]|nr:T9SS type A sorting domain-containing protein [Ignavibacteriaceae bacterium]